MHCATASRSLERVSHTPPHQRDPRRGHAARNRVASAYRTRTAYASARPAPRSGGRARGRKSPPTTRAAPGAAAGTEPSPLLVHAVVSTRRSVRIVPLAMRTPERTIIACNASHRRLRRLRLHIEHSLDGSSGSISSAAVACSGIASAGGGLRLRRLATTFGAEVAGIDLAAEWSDTLVSDLRAALRDHKLLIIPGQAGLSAQRLAAFAELFGEPGWKSSSFCQQYPVVLLQYTALTACR